jgi:hypothetical protein
VHWYAKEVGEARTRPKSGCHGWLGKFEDKSTRPLPPCGEHEVDILTIALNPAPLRRTTCLAGPATTGRRMFVRPAQGRFALALSTFLRVRWATRRILYTSHEQPPTPRGCVWGRYAQRERAHGCDLERTLDRYSLPCPRQPHRLRPDGRPDTGCELGPPPLGSAGASGYRGGVRTPPGWPRQAAQASPVCAGPYGSAGLMSWPSRYAPTPGRRSVGR